MRQLMTFLIALLTFSSYAFSQMMTGTIASGIGGAGRAAIDPGESALLNPAAVAHLNNYYSGVHYGLMNHSKEGDGSRTALVLSDGSSENVIAGAFTYVRKNVEIDKFSWSGQDFQASVAGFPFSKIAVGIAAHRFMSSISEVNSNQDNMHVGIMYAPNKDYGFGLVGYDLLNADTAVPAPARLKRTYAVAGNLIILDMFHFRLDILQQEVLNPGRRNEVMAGFETYFRDDFVFRMGGDWKEPTDQMFVTTGFGFKGPRLSFDYSFQKDIRAAEGSRHMFDLWLPL